MYYSRPGLQDRVMKRGILAKIFSEYFGDSDQLSVRANWINIDTAARATVALARVADSRFKCMFGQEIAFTTTLFASSYAKRDNGLGY